MPYSVEGYEDRAGECVKLANLAADPMVRTELLKLRQTYLTIAARLRQQGFESRAAERRDVQRRVLS
ncbi:MAG TPA: hypothetical protein VGB91_11090 [Rhizomicrobium sp.]